jgi:hypothetical protein
MLCSEARDVKYLDWLIDQGPPMGARVLKWGEGVAYPVYNLGLPDSPFPAVLVVAFVVSVAMLYGKLTPSPPWGAPIRKGYVVHSKFE